MTTGSEPTLRAARAEDAAELTELALRSKAHWGYSREFIDACREELTVRPDSIAAITVAELGGVRAGFRQLSVEGQDAELDALFVDPPFIGAGIGGRLLTEALAAARNRGVVRVGLDADPDAVGFYLRHGAIVVGETPSGSIPGRVLPRLEFTIRSG